MKMTVSTQARVDYCNQQAIPLLKKFDVTPELAKDIRRLAKHYIAKDLSRPTFSRELEEYKNIVHWGAFTRKFKALCRLFNCAIHDVDQAYATQKRHAPYWKPLLKRERERLVTLKLDFCEAADRCAKEAVDKPLSFRDTLSQYAKDLQQVNWKHSLIKVLGINAKAPNRADEEHAQREQELISQVESLFQLHAADSDARVSEVLRLIGALQNEADPENLLQLLDPLQKSLEENAQVLAANHTATWIDLKTQLQEKRSEIELFINEYTHADGAQKFLVKKYQLEKWTKGFMEVLDTLITYADSSIQQIADSLIAYLKDDLCPFSYYSLIPTAFYEHPVIASFPDDASNLQASANRYEDARALLGDVRRAAKHYFNQHPTQKHNTVLGDWYQEFKKSLNILCRLNIPF